MAIRIGALALVVLLASASSAQEVFYYPSKGQTPEQTEKDKMECYSWAKGQTGFDPMTPAPTPDTSSVQQAQQAKRGSAARGAARGAAVGAIGGAIGDDAGKGAAVGAGAGAAAGRMRANQQVRHVEAQAQQSYEAQLAAYNEKRGSWQRACNACMEGRGYSVK